MKITIKMGLTLITISQKIQLTWSSMTEEPTAKMKSTTMLQVASFLSPAIRFKLH